MLRSILLPFIISVIWIAPASAQFGGGGGNQGGGNQGGGNQGGGVGGIRIDASGLVERAPVRAGSTRDLRAELLEVAKSLPADINRVSPLRRVSLSKLDRELSRLVSEGVSIPPELRYVAGLTSISAIAIVDDGSDVIIAGPAEGFAPGRDGRVVGVESGRPVVCLDDLLVALRNVDDRAGIGCSFDPDPDRLVSARTVLEQDLLANSKADAERHFQKTADIMGNWNVCVNGVPTDSRMAVAMVEADFLLKRLTTGTEKSGVRGFKSFLAAMKPNDDVLKRWWFSPQADVLERSADARLFRLSGQRLRVSGQDEIVDDQGNRTDAPVTAENLNEYAREFTERLPQLAEKYPSLAHLQNLVDVLVMAAVVRSSLDRGILSWEPVALLDAERLPAEQYLVPKETPSVVSVRMAGSRTVIGLIAGGVVITPDRLLADARTSSLEPIATSSSDAWWWD